MGLLVLEDARIVAANPSAAASLVVTPMGQQGAQLLAESAQWAQAFTGIGQAWRNAPGRSVVCRPNCTVKRSTPSSPPSSLMRSSNCSPPSPRPVAVPPRWRSRPNETSQPSSGAYEGLHTALAVREPSMVAYLVDMFERTWDRGRPFAHQGSTVSTNPGRRKLRPSMAQAEFSHWRRRRDLNSREV